jgi:hypothetical protein
MVPLLSGLCHICLYYAAQSYTMVPLLSGLRHFQITVYSEALSYMLLPLLSGLCHIYIVLHTLQRCPAQVLYSLDSDILILFSAIGTILQYTVVPVPLLSGLCYSNITYYLQHCPASWLPFLSGLRQIYISLCNTSYTVITFTRWTLQYLYYCTLYDTVLLTGIFSLH